MSTNILSVSRGKHLARIKDVERSVRLMPLKSSSSWICSRIICCWTCPTPYAAHATQFYRFYKSRRILRRSPTFPVIPRVLWDRMDIAVADVCDYSISRPHSLPAASILLSISGTAERGPCVSGAACVGPLPCLQARSVLRPHCSRVRPALRDKTSKPRRTNRYCRSFHSFLRAVLRCLLDLYDKISPLLSCSGSLQPRYSVVYLTRFLSMNSQEMIFSPEPITFETLSPVSLSRDNMQGD